MEENTKELDAISRFIEGDQEIRRNPLFQMRAISALVLGFLAGGSALWAQTTPAMIQFEVASVKPNTLGGAAGNFAVSPGGLTITNYSLLRLISNAYGLHEYLIVGGPSWRDTDRFDVMAKAAEGSRPSRQELNLMLQSLLADRFNLRVRRDTTLGPVYSLVIARTDGTLGPHLRRSAVDCAVAPESIRGDLDKCGRRYGFDSVQERGMPLAPVVGFLESLVKRPVIDRTGLTGPFDLDLEYSRDGSTDSPKPSIFTALQEQLGLKLVPEQGPVETLVIEHAEHPTPN
jgi:uncharacterized protein (TIGR03435 family)